MKSEKAKLEGAFFAAASPAVGLLCIPLHASLKRV